MAKVNANYMNQSGNKQKTPKPKSRAKPTNRREYIGELWIVMVTRQAINSLAAHLDVLSKLMSLQLHE